MTDEHPPAYAATPSATLEQQIMDPRIPKSEREWWAAGEIERLQLYKHMAEEYGLSIFEDLVSLKAENERLKHALRLAADEPNIDRARAIADAVLEATRP